MEDESDDGPCGSHRYRLQSIGQSVVSSVCFGVMVGRKIYI